MSCISNIAQLRNDTEFKDWMLKLKDTYPNMTDDLIEDRLVSFINLNNGNMPGYTPFGEESDTFKKLTKAYDGDEARAFEMYEHLFTKDFISEFGDWCGVTDTSGFTEDELNKYKEQNKAKLQKAVRNSLGEPALLFVNSVKHKAASDSVGVTNSPDEHLRFKIVVDDGEAHVIVGYDRPVLSGSITFAIQKHSNRPLSSDDVYIDTEDIDKTYDFTSGNFGFSEKRLSAFIALSSKDLYYVSLQIAKVNGLFRANRINGSREDAINYIKKTGRKLVFDTDPDSPYGCIQLAQVSIGGGTVWQILSPEGIFCEQNRYSANSTSYADRVALKFFINAQNLAYLKDLIVSLDVVNVVKPDSYLSAPIIDYENHGYVLKPSTNRTLHNVKTEFGLAYAMYMKDNDKDRFTKYLNIAKQFPDIRQNSAGAGEIKDVNMIGNLIGALLSGQLIDSNYYTAHSFDVYAIELAIFVSRHTVAIRKMVKALWDDVNRDIQAKNMAFLRDGIDHTHKVYEKIDFSDVADSISRNRTVNKLTDDDFRHSFCDSIDKVKAAYRYRKNDSGNRKLYDSTEYTKLASSCELLNVLNKLIKLYLIHQDGSDDTVSGEEIERLVNLYFQCIETIISIMDDDILKIEDFVLHTPAKYTPEYYSQLLYIDRSIIKMYTNDNNKTIIEKLFKLDSESSDMLQKTLYDVFSQKQIRTFESLRTRFYDNYTRLNNKRKINGEQSSLLEIINTMIDDAILHIIDDWCNHNLKCLTEEEERDYREKLKLDLSGHIHAGMPLDTAIGGSASSAHNIVNVLYSIILTQQHRSDLLIKLKGDYLLKLFKDTFGSSSPFNQCALFCEIVEVPDKKWVTRKNRKVTSGYFIRNVNYGQYYRAKVTEQRRLLKQIPTNNGVPYYTIDEDKSTATKLVIEWGVGSELYRIDFLNKMDMWIDKNANRRYTAQYYIKRREILGKERNGIVVGTEAENRQNLLRRQIDGIKNRYRDKDSKVFLPFKVPPVLKKILASLELLLADLSSPYEKYVDQDGNSGIRLKSGLDLAIALNIQEWNKFTLGKRKYSQDVDRYKQIEDKLRSKIGNGITQENFDEFVNYYHRDQAKLEYYDALQKRYDGMYGERQQDLDDIRFKRRSILSRVRKGRKGLYQFPDLDELTDSEWEELTKLDVDEDKIKSEFQDLFNNLGSISIPYLIPGKTPGKTFYEEHKELGRLHEYTDSQGNEYELSVYRASRPADDDLIEVVLSDEFSVEDSEYMNRNFDPTNSSYEQPKEKDDSGKVLYRNDKYYEIKKNDKLFKLYETFLEYMREANEMFGYAAISSNYKLPLIYEREASVYIGRGCNAANTFVYKMKRSFLIDERDFDRSYTSDIHADGTSSGKLRKRFVEMLSDPEHISTDLVYSVMAYYMTACRYSDKQNILAQCELINRKILSLEEKSNKVLRTQADNTVDTFLFENTMNTGTAGAAVAERFMEHTTAVMLKWKLKTAIKAFIDGYRLLTNVLLSNKWNARGHFFTATSRAIKETFPSIWSSIDTLDYSLSEALMSLNNINIQSFLDANKTKFTRAYLKSGLMPMLTVIDHITTKSILETVYDSIRVYDNGDGTKSFYNIDEYITQYTKKHIDEYITQYAEKHPESSKSKAKKEAKKRAKEEAEKLYWSSKPLRDAYQLGKRDKNGKIIKGTENILNVKDEYANMFSSNAEENADAWALLQGKVLGLIDEMAAAINGYKPNDTKSANTNKKWYLKAIFQIRSFLISNYNELFKHSDALKSLAAEHSENKTTEAINKFWSTDLRIVQWLNAISSEREMYNVLTSTKDVGYYFGFMSYFRKLLENLIIYIGSKHYKQDPDYRNITNAEKVSVVNAFLIMSEGFMFYNTAFYIAGLLTCLLGLGSSPDDDDEWFIHWFLWTAYDIAGSMFNDTFVSLPTGDTVIDLFRGIMAMVPAFQQLKQSVLNSDDVFTFVSAMFGFGDDENSFEDYEYGTDENPFNLIKSGKWQGEMYGKRRFYEAVLNTPWLVFPVVGFYMPEIPIANLKESFSAYAARAKSSYTFNNLSPIDYMRLGTPSSTDESYEKFHDYGPLSSGAMLFNSLMNELGSEEEDVLDFVRSLQSSEYSPIPDRSPVDKIERMIPLGRQYDD